MKLHWCFFTLLFCWSATNLCGQGMAGHDVRLSVVSEWNKAVQSIVLLKNESNLLPLKDLSTLHIHTLTFGLPNKNTFSETLEKYTRIEPFPKVFSANSLVVIGLSAAEYSPVNPDFTAFEQQLEALVEKNKVITVLFGNPEIIVRMPALRKAAALISLPFEDETSQSLAAQLIFGGTSASGKLAQDIGDFYKTGEGLNLAEKTRLGYAPPEMAGMDAQLLSDSIGTIVEEGIRAHAYPGAQVLVAKDGLVVFHRAYGYHTYDSLQAVSTTDIYDFASVTKVTSTLPALMKFYGEGTFDPDAPLKQYLPFFKKSDKGDVSCRQFLAHNGRLKPGIVFWREAQNEDGQWKRRTFKNHYSRRYPIQVTDSLFLFKKHYKRMYKGIRDLPLNEKPGYVYSDLSFILYPLVVEKLSGEATEPFLKKTFYEPLGAYTLTYNPLKSFPKERIVPTERDTFFRKRQVQGTVHDENAAMLGGVSGHAGLFGSANDLAKLFQMYLNGGEYGGERFISTKAVEEFTRCQYCKEGNRRGLGFDKPLIVYNPQESYVAKSASPASFGHSGYTGTFVWADPASNLLVIFFSNRVYPDRSSRGLYDLNIRARVQQAAYDAILSH